MSSFTRDLIVRVTPHQIRGRTVFVIAEEFQYCVGSLENPVEIISVPVGFETDFVSIPFWLRMFINNAHRAKAAVVHDFLLKSGRDARESDDIFKEALGVLDAGVFEKNLYWVAVRITSMVKQAFGKPVA